MITVATIGVYDLLHPGHLDFLKAAAGWGDELVVGIPSDSMVIAIKGRPPIMNQVERATMLQALGLVRAVDILPSLDYAAWIRALQPIVLALSVDHKAQRFTAAAEAMAELRGDVVRIPRSPKCSTTEIIERIKERR